MPTWGFDVRANRIAVPTAAEAALIRGMNHQGDRRYYGASGVFPTNIAALYFDGRELAEMVKAKESVDKLRDLRAWV